MLLLSVSHLSQAVVATAQVPLQAGQGHHHHTLHLTALRARAGRRKAQSTDAAAGTHSGRQHVALVEHSRGDLRATDGVKSLHVVTWYDRWIAEASTVKLHSFIMSASNGKCLQSVLRLSNQLAAP